MEFLDFLPVKTKQEILRMLEKRNAVPSEIHIRADGRCTVNIGEERVNLSSVSGKDAEETVKRALGNSLYRGRDMLEEGYLPLGGGVRLGVCGQARYNGGEIVGISKVSSLVFRIPSAESDVGEELCSAFLKSKRGMLIFSAPGVGKTTALRKLAYLLGRGKNSPNIAIIDERCEFSHEQYKDCSVDILSGYKRERGMEIALRTLSPEIMIIDEIGRREEVVKILDFLSSGVRFIASAHASSHKELLNKRNLAPLLLSSVFDVFAEIYGERGVRKVNIRWQNEICGNDFNDSFCFADKQEI